MIKNYAEILIDEIYNEMKSFLVNCNSINCEMDIKSMALNELPTAYFTSDISEAEKKAYLLDRQRRTSFLAKLTDVSATVCAKCMTRRDS